MSTALTIAEAVKGTPAAFTREDNTLTMEWNAGKYRKSVTLSIIGGNLDAPEIACSELPVSVYKKAYKHLSGLSGRALNESFEAFLDDVYKIKTANTAAALTVGNVVKTRMLKNGNLQAEIAPDKATRLAQKIAAMQAELKALEASAEPSNN